MPAGSPKAEKQPTLEENEWVRECRGRLIHLLIAENQGNDGADLKHILKLLQTDPRWPEAHWGGARKGPPDYQQVRNAVARLEMTNKIARVGAPRNPYGYLIFESVALPDMLERPMRKRAKEALGLQAEGKSIKEIGEILGISYSLASGLVDDPYGEKERERKKAYCPVCGTKLDGSVDWCRKCKQEKAENLLPPRDFLAVITRVKREQQIDVLFGVTHDCVRVIRMATQRGMVEHKLPSRQSWDDALEELGLV